MLARSLAPPPFRRSAPRLPHKSENTHGRNACFLSACQEFRRCNAARSTCESHALAACAPIFHSASNTPAAASDDASSTAFTNSTPTGAHGTALAVSKSGTVFTTELDAAQIKSFPKAGIWTGTTYCRRPMAMSGWKDVSPRIFSLSTPEGAQGKESKPLIALQITPNE